MVMVTILSYHHGAHPKGHCRSIQVPGTGYQYVLGVPLSITANTRLKEGRGLHVCAQASINKRAVALKRY